MRRIVSTSCKSPASHRLWISPTIRMFDWFLHLFRWQGDSELEYDDWLITCPARHFCWSWNRLNYSMKQEWQNSWIFNVTEPLQCWWMYGPSFIHQRSSAVSEEYAAASGDSTYFKMKGCQRINNPFRYIF